MTIAVDMGRKATKTNKQTKPTRRVGEYNNVVFGKDPVGVGVNVRFFVSVHYLLNQLMDFDQTCIETLLGGGEELI